MNPQLPLLPLPTPTKNVNQMEKVAKKPNLGNDSPANLSTTKASYRPHMLTSAFDLATGTTSPDSPMATSAPKKEIAINESKKTSRCKCWL